VVASLAGAALFDGGLVKSRSEGINGMTIERGGMVVEPARSEPSCTAPGSPAAPSCYRVSFVSESLEVSARVKSADDLELLLRVLGANKALFTKADHSGTETVVKASETADGAKTDGFAKAHGEAETSSRVDRLANGILTP
jgi:hypothetical protein